MDENQMLEFSQEKNQNKRKDDQNRSSDIHNEQQVKSKRSHYQETLRIINEVRISCIGLNEFQIDIPCFVVLGDQSSGKSSLLGALGNGLLLPEQTGCCTKVPTLINLRNRSKKLIKVGFRGKMTEYKTFEEAKKQVANCQNEILKESNNQMFAETEVSVLIESPDQEDLDLVDLPDNEVLINKLIQKYISKKQTMIICCIEANKDIACAAAYTKALEVDPDLCRTIKIITKCDQIESIGRKLKLREIIKKEEQVIMGSHAVCCRINGQINKSFESENQKIQQQLDSVPLRSGTKNLKERLSKILQQKIKENVPIILQNIQQWKFQAKEKLLKIGQLPVQNDKVLLEIQKEMKKDHFSIENSLIVPTYKFKEAIQQTEQNLTTQWISEQQNIQSIFNIPFVNDSTSFLKCIEIIAKEWWRPIAEQYKLEIMNLISNLPKLNSTIYENSIIFKYIEIEWKNYLNTQLTKKIDEQLTEIIQIENIFGTVDDSLIINYFSYIQCQHIHSINCFKAKEIIEQFVEKMFKSKEDQLAQTLGVEDIRNYLDEYLHQDNQNRFEDNIICDFQKENDSKEYFQTIIESQKQGALVSAVKSYFHIMVKNFTESVFKKVQQTYKILREEWIDSHMTKNQHLLKNAKEPNEITEERERQQTIVKKMILLEQKLQKIKE